MSRRGAASARALVDVPPPAAERIASACTTIAAAVRELVLASLESSSKSLEYFDQVTSPLGRRRHCDLCRRGALRARKAGRRWLVARKDLEAYLDAHGQPALTDDSPAMILRRIAG